MKEDILEVEDCYTGFAKVYDSFMDNIPYEDWFKNLVSILEEEEIRDGLILDLACGTGILTEMMQEAGYDMIGLDFSEEMLDEARRKGSPGILYLNQDMREFELYGTVRAIYCLCDGMNYLTSKEDVLEVLKLANNYLDPHGIFVFDYKTNHYFSGLGAQTIVDNRETGCLIWENDYHKETRTNEYLLTIFEQEGEFFVRRMEEHIQMALEIEEIKVLIKESGMDLVACTKALSKEAGSEEDDRVYFICREQGKHWEGEIDG